MNRTNRERPIHKQIADQLRRRVVSGRYESSGLPPELKLVEEFGVSRHTIRTALQSLVHDGLIERRAGLGTRVRKRVRAEAWAIESLEDLIGEFRIEHSLTLSAEIAPARRFPRVADLFGVRRTERLFHVLRLLPAKDSLAISHAFTTAKLGSQLPPQEIGIKPIIELVERHCGVLAICARQVASAAAADADTAAHLGIKIGDPVLVLHRSYFDSEYRRIVHAEMTCRPDRYQQVVDFVRERRAMEPAELVQVEGEKKIAGRAAYRASGPSSSA